MTEPSIIRQDSLHEVTVNEGSLVAATKSLDPNGPSVRKTLAGEEPPEDKAQSRAAPAIPPPVAARPAAEGQVFERSLQQDDDTQAAPDALGTAAAEGAVFKRELEQDADLQQAQAPAAGGSAQGPVIDRSLQDRAAEGSHDLRPSSPGAQGLQDGQALQDRFVAAPDGLPVTSNARGPAGEGSLKDRFTGSPDADPAENIQAIPSDGAAPDQVLRAQVSVPGDHMVQLPAQDEAGPDGQSPPDQRSQAANIQHLPPEAAPRTGAQELSAPQETGLNGFAVEPGLGSGPSAQAPKQSSDAVSDVQSRVEEILGAADQEWVEMDFPARVIKLKVENDKVRTKLDRLEAMARAPMR